MKKIKNLLVVFLLIPVLSMWSQSIEITPSYGAQFGSKLNYGVNFIKFQNSAQFGITIAVELDTDIMGEISYFNHNTEMRLRDIVYSPEETRLADLNLNWVLLGSTYYFGDDIIRPFVGGGAGLVFVSPKNQSDLIDYTMSNETKFSFYAKGGVNFMFSDAIGLNIQGNLFIPIEWGGFYTGIGPGGISTGISTRSTTLLAGISAGLVFKLGD